MNFPKLMDLQKLRIDVESENENSLLICDQGEDFILTDDLEELCYIRYHFAPPTENWIKNRMVWTQKSMQYKEKWESIFAKTACLIDWNMLIPLNNIIIMYNAANEEEQDDVCKLLDIEPYEFPSFNEDLLGLKWSFYGNIIINISSHIDVAKTTILRDKEFEKELKFALLTTLIHELRHLGLESNPFLPKEDYPDSEKVESRVEEWCIATYESICDKI